MAKETHKEKVYKILKEEQTGTPLSMTPIAQEVGCTLSHLSIIFRMAKEAGYLEIHKKGNYAIKKIPDTYEEFKENINEKTNSYRKQVRGTTKPRRKGFSRAPEKIDITNILTVIDDLIQKSTKLENLERKYDALMKFTKKLRKITKK